MQPLTTSEVDFERFLLIAGGHTAFQLLWAGVQFDLFTLLANEPGLDRDALAERLQLSDQPLRILLLGLTSLGLLEKQDETYSCSPLAAEMLNRENPRNVPSRR